MRKEISDFLVISVVLVAFIGVVIIGILLTAVLSENMFGMFISYVYLATYIFFLVISYIRLGKKMN